MSRTPGDSRADARQSDADLGADVQAPAPGQLRDRLERLPAGHPSSPYELDGSRRDSIPRLRDLDTGITDEDDSGTDGDYRPDQRVVDASQPGDATRPFTDAEWADHRAETRVRLIDANAVGLASDHQYTTDPDRSRWTRDRRLLQNDIADTIYGQAANVPNEGRAIIAGGLCGAGKTTVLDDYAGIDRSQYLTISPDDIKEELARRGLIPEIEGLSPMEASDLVHNESSYIARQLAMRAKADGKNVIWDITMSSRQSTEQRIDELREAGYKQIDAIFVDIPVEVSIRRADARHREGEDDYRSGKGLGGRYIPPEAITAQADSEWGSKNRKAFEELKTKFDNWTRFENGVDGLKPIRVAASRPDDHVDKDPS